MDEAALHELLSGRRTSLSATLLRSGLQVMSWGYSSAMDLRNAGYRTSWLRVHRIGVPVISIGNITTGGTGKTPLAAWLANWLLEQGQRPGLLSRGYRSLHQAASGDDGKPLNMVAQGNDEKLVLDRLCPGVPHLQQRDRVASATRAVVEFGCNALLLDDGFQHRRMHRDLDLVLVDALQPWGYGHVLPRGLLREAMSGLRRADLILATRANQCSVDQLQSLRAELRRWRGTDECVEIAFTPQQLVDQYWRPHPLDTVSGKRAIAFCGIGNPHGFRQTVDSLRAICQSLRSFPDHHHYNPEEISQLADMARESNSDVVLTTQKDLVKIAADDWNGPPLFAVEIGVQFINGRELLESRLRQILETNK